MDHAVVWLSVVRRAAHLQERFLVPRWGRRDLAGLTTWLSSGRLVAEKTITRAELGGKLIHALSIMTHWTAD